MQVLAITGPHASGKSTIIRHLETNGFETRPEIASVLIERHGYDWGRHGDAKFQEKIFNLEVERDKRLLAAEASVAIETWHFGNIAHCIEIGSSDLVERQKTYLSKLRERDDVEMAALHLSISFEEMVSRSPHVTAEDDETREFYRRIESNILALYHEYDIEHIVVKNAPGDLEGTLKTALGFAERVVNR